MARKIVFFSILVKEGAWVRAYLNDLPLYTGERGANSQSGTINELMVPGENELTLELVDVPTPLYEPYLDGAVEVRFYEVLDPRTTPITKRIIHEATFPEILTRAPEERRHFPFLHRSFFDPGFDIHPPPWLAAPPATFPCAGTPELREAVRRLHAAVDGNDADQFLSEIALKLDHHERAFEGHERASAQSKREAFRDDLFAHRLTPRPLDLDELHFEPRCGGRVAYVTRPAGGPALEAACLDMPQRRLRTDLLLTQYAGDWRVFA